MLPKGAQTERFYPSFRFIAATLFNMDVINFGRTSMNYGLKHNSVTRPQLVQFVCVTLVVRQTRVIVQ